MADNKIFENRLVCGSDVYLFPADCAYALGFCDVADYIQNYSKVLESVAGIDNMMKESVFNHILQRNSKALERIDHVEVTKVQTLRAESSTLKSIYPLKLMFARDRFKREAIVHNCSAVDEYIKKYDFLAEIHEKLSLIQYSTHNIDDYYRRLKQLENVHVIDPKVLADNGLEIQTLTLVSKSGYISVENFIVGDGIFYQLYLDIDYGEPIYFDKDGNWLENPDDPTVVSFEYQTGDEDYTKVFVTEKGELCFKDYYDEKSKSLITKNVGRTNQDRDFRKYTVIENIMWVIQNGKINDDSVNMSGYELPGVYMYIDDMLAIELLSQNIYGEHIFINGAIELDEDIFISDLEGVRITANDN